MEKQSILDEKNAKKYSTTEKSILRMGNKKKPNISLEELENIIISEYAKDNSSITKVCKKTGLTATKVKYILNKNHIHVKTKQEVLKEHNISQCKVNINYFKNESSNMAWILGFLASDGYISSDDNTIRICLSTVDKEILERIKIELQCKNKIKEYITTSGYPSCRLSWCCCEHKKDLDKYSITPKKTFIIKPPYNLSKKYCLDYIRGVFDGDGSVSLIHGKSGNSLRWQLCSASEGFLDWIVDFLYEEYDIPKVRVQKKKEKKNFLYLIQYSTNATKKIYSILYSTDSTFYLKRKKDKFDNIIKSFEIGFQESPNVMH